MQTIFDAENNLEAHMVVGMLEQHGISAWVLGDTLQGGAGELPVGALARVVTNDGQAEEARRIVREWEETQPPATEYGRRGSALEAPGSIAIFLLGFATGAATTMLLVRHMQ